MLLAVEVGNTNTTFGLFAASRELTTSYRLSTERERMPDEWFAMLAALLASDRQQLSDVDGVIISSVVPSVTTWLVDMSRNRLGIDPVIVSGDLDVGLDLDVSRRVLRVRVHRRRPPRRRRVRHQRRHAAELHPRNAGPALPP